MNHSLEARRLGHLVEGIWLRNVRHDDHLEAVGAVLVRVADLLRLVFRAHGGDDGVALLEELLKDVGWRMLES